MCLQPLDRTKLKENEWVWETNPSSVMMSLVILMFLTPPWHSSSNVHSSFFSTAGGFFGCVDWEKTIGVVLLLLTLLPTDPPVSLFDCCLVLVLVLFENDVVDPDLPSLSLLLRLFEIVFGEDGVELGGDVSPCAEPNKSPKVWSFPLGLVKGDVIGLALLETGRDLSPCVLPTPPWLLPPPSSLRLVVLEKVERRLEEAEER